jgi:hypothetical protein
MNTDLHRKEEADLESKRPGKDKHFLSCCFLVRKGIPGFQIQIRYAENALPLRLENETEQKRRDGYVNLSS